MFKNSVVKKCKPSSKIQLFKKENHVQTANKYRTPTKVIWIKIIEGLS